MIEKIKINFNIYLFFPIMFFIYLYNIKISFLPSYTGRYIVILAIIYIIYMYFKKNLFINSNILFLIYICGAYILYAVLNYIINDFNSSIMIKSALLMCFYTFIGSYFLVYVLVKKHITFETFLLFMQFVILIQAIFIIFYFINSDFRSFCLEFIPPKSDSNINFYTDIMRPRGLTNWSGASLSIIQCFGLFFTAYLLPLTNYKTNKYIYLVCSFLIILLSITLTGRTGLISIFFILLYFYKLEKNSQQNKNILYFLAINLICFIILLIAINILFLSSENNTITQALEEVKSRFIFEVLSPEGEFRLYTVNVLLNHWFLPNNIFTFLIGNPSTWDINRIPSDVGIIRLLYAIGFFGTLLFYALFVFTIYKSIKLSSERNQKFFILLIGIFLFLCETKEPFLIKNQVSIFICMIFYFLNFQNILKKQNEK